MVIGKLPCYSLRIQDVTTTVSVLFRVLRKEIYRLYSNMNNEQYAQLFFKTLHYIFPLHIGKKNRIDEINWKIIWLLKKDKTFNSGPGLRFKQLERNVACTHKPGHLPIKNETFLIFWNGMAIDSYVNLKICILKCPF